MAFKSRMSWRGAESPVLRNRATRPQNDLDVRRLRMWSRRHFLEIVSGVPFLGGSAEASRSFLPAGAPVVAAGARRFSRAAPPGAAPDYFSELGVRPFIYAAWTVK